MQEKDKVKKKRKRKKKRYLLKFFILLILAASLYFFFSSSMFDIQKITVENNNHYTKEQLISLAGVRTGENLFKASLSQMKENLLADPYVKNVKLRKRLPAEVVISVQERSGCNSKCCIICVMSTWYKQTKVVHFFFIFYREFYSFFSKIYNV
jgi:cell division protein FtsQ